jgi:LmbE family N-acetylglucosaminyl deacetylase
MTEELQPMPEDWSRALAIAAHPDDLEFGAAGAIAAWTAAGKSVSYVLVTRGEAGIDGMAPAEAMSVRSDEQRASAKIVGVDEVEFLDHPDGAIENGLALRRDLAAAIRRHRPELVVTFNHHDKTYTGKWNSSDHRNTGRAVLDAIADAGNRWIFPSLGEGEEATEPWGGVRYAAVAGSPWPTHAVDIETTLDVAVASVEAHAAYLRGLGLPAGAARGGLSAFANATGERFGGRPAIPFELVNV